MILEVFLISHFPTTLKPGLFTNILSKYFETPHMAVQNLRSSLVITEQAPLLCIGFKCSGVC